MFSTFTAEWYIYSRHFTQNGVNVLEIYYLDKVGIALLTLDNYLVVCLVNYTFFPFCGTFKSFFSNFGLGSGTTKAAQRNKFMFSWKIRPNPFTSRQMTCGIARVLPSQSCKILPYDDQFRFFIRQVAFAFTRPVSTMK